MTFRDWLQLFGLLWGAVVLVIIAPLGLLVLYGWILYQLWPDFRLK